LDYPGYRAEARVTDLHLDESGFQCVPLLTSPLPTEFDGSAYAERLRERVPADLGSPTAVLGYCVSAPLACELVASLPGTPKLVVFDAEGGSPDAITQAYRTALAEYGEPVHTAPPGDLTSDPRAAVSGMVRELQQRAAAAYQAEGCGPAEADELAREAGKSWQDWLTHLAAAYRTQRPRWRGVALHVMSAEYRGPQDWIPQAMVVRCDASAADLLRSTAARQAVLEFL
jgi:hypothetical protein